MISVPNPASRFSQTRNWQKSTFVLLFAGLFSAGSLPSATAAEFNIPDGDVASLVSAITTANSNGESDVINLAPAGSYTLSTVDNFLDGVNGLPSISSDITIDGTNAVVRRDNSTTDPLRLFHVSAGGNLILTAVNAQSGLSATGTGGGALYVQADATATLIGCVFFGNTAGDGEILTPNGADGGAIFSAGSLSIIGSSFLSNRAGNGSTPLLISDPQGNGGWGGAIAAVGTTTISASEFESNLAGDGADGAFLGLTTAGAGGYGGGIFNGGVMTLANCNVTSNSSGNGGDAPAIIFPVGPGERLIGFGGSGGDGGGIYSDGTLIVEESNISGNRTGTGGLGFGGIGFSGESTERDSDQRLGFIGGAAGSGGGIAIIGQADIINSVIDNNSLGFAQFISGNGYGGGVDITGPFVGFKELRGIQGPSTTQVTFTGCTISNNEAFAGGGIAAHGDLFTGTGDINVVIVNCTISTNVAIFPAIASVRAPAFDGVGGGLYVEGSNTSTTVDLRNSTVAFNTAATEGGAIATVSTAITPLGGGGVSSNAIVRATHTILANNTPDSCAGTGVVESLGYNLDDSTTCCFSLSTDLCGADARLEPLSDNGGNTLTHALGAGSAASDAGDPGFGSDPSTDQRGFARIQGSAIDIGAVEFFQDCNANNIDDNAELNLTTDQNSNLILDECESSVAIVKTVSDSPVEAGDTFQYILTSINLASTASSATTVTDVLAPGLTFIESDPPATSGPNPLVYVQPSIPSLGQTSITVTVRAECSSIGPLTNTATIQAIGDTDLSDNTSSATTEIQDTTPPVISCPSDISLETCQTSTTVTLGTPEASDNCSLAIIDSLRSDGLALNDPFGTGTTTVTYTAFDSSGNSASCSQSVTLTDGNCVQCTEVDLLTEEPQLIRVRCRTRRGVLNCSVIARVRTRNAGTVSSIATRTSFFLSDDTTFDSSDIFIGSKGYGPVRPGRTMNTPGRGPLPTGVNPEGKYILAVADFPGNNLECNETNNVIVVGQVAESPTSPRR